MGFDAVLELVMDGPNRQIVLQFLERLLDLDQLEIEPPEMAGVVAPDVGAKQIAAFTPPGDAKLLAVQREMERLRGDRLILRRRYGSSATRRPCRPPFWLRRASATARRASGSAL